MSLSLLIIIIILSLLSLFLIAVATAEELYCLRCERLIIKGRVVFKRCRYCKGRSVVWHEWVGGWLLAVCHAPFGEFAARISYISR